MPNNTIRVLGVRSTIRALNDLKKAVQTRVAKRAVNLGTNPQLKRARSLAPRERTKDDEVNYGNRKDLKKPRLHKALVKRVKYNRRTGDTYSFVGAHARTNAMFYIHLAESGADGHEIKPKQPGGRLAFMLNGRMRFPARVFHPGTKGTRFLENAGRSTKRDQLYIVRNELKKGVAREAAKVAAKAKL